MIEKLYKFTTEEKVEKIVDDENMLLNHMVFNKGEGLPEHYSNSNVYLIVTQGILSIKLDEQEGQEYIAGSIVNIPYHIKMNIINNHEGILEFFVVKAPNPRDYVAE